MAYNPEFMKEAIRIAVKNVENGTGGPFGAVVVRDVRLSQPPGIRLCRIMIPRLMRK